MRLSALTIFNFRNLEYIDLNFAKPFSCFIGENGSGKTSILEAVYFLGHGRSFRSAQIQRIIQYSQPAFTLHAKVQDDLNLLYNIGIERSLQGDSITKIAGKAQANSGELAQALPTLLIHPNAYRLLDCGPKIRRQFIDWGLFHVEQSFYPLWKHLNRILKQRNVLIRQGQSYEMIAMWDRDFVKISNEINKLRIVYLEKLLPIVMRLLDKFVKLPRLRIEYSQGWAKERELEIVLEQAHSKDIERGYSYYGPQRADLLIKIGEHPAHEVLSRGQQKLLVIAMKLAQGILLKEWCNKTCVFLLDDITAELDETRQRFVIETLRGLQSQVLMSMLDEASLYSLDDELEMDMFHVEHGQITRANSRVSA
jgi:DNA replication and repair protein RecF